MRADAETLVASGRRWRIDPGIGPELRAALVDPARLMEPPATPLKRVKGAGTPSVVRRDGEDGQCIVVKRYTATTAAGRWRERLRPSRALAAFRSAREFLDAGAPTPRPLAATAPELFGDADSYLIVEETPDATTLYLYAADCASTTVRRRLAREFGALLAKLHDRDRQFADPSLTNVLVADRSAARPRLVLIDLDGWRRRRMTPAKCVEGLRRLAERSHVTGRDALAFLAAYCRARATPLDVRETARRVGPVALGSASPPPPRSAT